MLPRDSSPELYPHRACDGCRRKKARCDSIDHSCTNCRRAGQACSFDIPPGKRGPKGKPRRRNIIDVQHDTPQHDVPQQQHSAQSYPYSPAAQSPQQAPRNPTTLQRYRLLADAVAQASSSLITLESVIQECADLFFRYIVPFNMSVHEPTFRHTLNQARSSSPPGASLTESNFTLITAVCAKVCFFVPSELFPVGARLAEPFLEASRSCFSTYAEADLENPCADSITIRYLHSNCLHTCARSVISWHVYGEAVRLAQRMRLHDEDSYVSLPPIEAEMRRNAFWHLYVGDKSLAVLRSMPMTLYEYSFDEGITAAYPSVEQNEFVEGVNADIRLWQYAADLLLRMRLIKSSQTPGSDLSDASLTAASYETLGRLYVRFATCIDHLPPHLQPHTASLLETKGNDTTHNKFAAQIADIYVTYHCLKMHLTRKLEEVGYFSRVGEYKDMLVLRKTEIARDMIALLQAIPFWSLKINGEPCAEKIRLVGTSLLAIIQEPSTLAPRARGDFMIVLDILSRLDSKASDALRQEML
ncbi:Transcription factor [Ilyonectria robusta]